MDHLLVESLVVDLVLVGVMENLMVVIQKDQLSDLYHRQYLHQSKQIYLLMSLEMNWMDHLLVESLVMD